MKIFIFIAILLISINLQARVTGNVIVEGLDTTTNKNLSAIIKPEFKENFSSEDVQKAIEILFSQGVYRNIEAYYEDVGSKTNIYFVIEPVRFIKKIIFAGNSTINTNELQTELKLSEADPLDEETLKAGVENIKKLYNLAGYLNAQVTATWDAATTSDLTLIISIKENQVCKIQKLDFKSANTKLNEALLKNSRSFMGQNFSQSQLDQLSSHLNNYLIQEKYFSAQLLSPEYTYNADKTSIIISFIVSEPYSYALVFEGNTVFTYAQFLSELKLDSNNRLSSSPVDDLTERLLQLYRSRGYANVTVKSREVLYAQEYSKRLTFTIKEGPKVRIKDIQFEGLLSKPQKYYKNFILEHSSDLVDSGFYSSADIETGVKNLIIELQNQGYIAAKTLGVRTDYDKTREFAIIKVSLDEGPQTFVEKVTFSGNKNISKEKLEETIGFKAHTPLQLSRLEEATTKIMQVYRDMGYLDVQITNQGQSVINYYDENTKATLSFQISEGPLIRVGAIAVEGNRFTKDYVIKRELQFEKGDIITPENLSYSEERLQKLGLFRTIDMQILKDDPREGERTVLVRVIEQDPGLFKSGVGVNNELGLSLKGYLGTSYNNLFGTGRSLTARAEGNYKVYYKFIENDLNFGYTEPFIFNTRNNARFGLTRSTKLFSAEKFILPSGGVEDRLYAVDTVQGDLLIERDLTRNLKFIYDIYNITRTNLFEVNNLTASTPLTIVTTGPTFILDLRDNIFNPTRGWLASYSFEYSNPYFGSTKTVHYYKMLGNISKYVPLGRVVWATETRGGYLKNLNQLGDGAVPTVRAFYIGGRSTIRGFKAVTDTLPLVREIPNGIPTESYFGLVRTEFRIPIFGNVATGVFYDGGLLEIPGVTTYAHSLHWRDSVGIALRYNTPVGPFGVEFAHKLNRDPQRPWEGDFDLFLNIGVF